MTICRRRQTNSPCAPLLSRFVSGASNHFSRNSSGANSCRYSRQLIHVWPPAGDFAGDHVELVALEHGHRGPGGLQEEVLLAASEPEQAQAVLGLGVIQGRFVPLLPLLVGRLGAEAAGVPKMPEV